MRLRPGHITAFLVSAFSVALIGAVGYPLLESPQPASAALPPAVIHHHKAADTTAQTRVFQSEHATLLTYTANRIRTEQAEAAQDAWQLRRERAAASHAAQVAARQAAQRAQRHATTPVASYPSSSGSFTQSSLEALWEAEGGSAATAPIAACISYYESTWNPAAFNGRDIGLFQIDPGNFPGDNLYNAATNAADAVKLSQDGTNWTDWSTASACGV